MPKMKLKVLGPLLSTLFLCSTGGDAAAQNFEAFCALRDPEREIRLLAPGYESFRSLVRTITTDSREKILDEVPFSMHFDELGQHTLYVVRSEEDFHGYVHVRSESFKWGLVRIAWLMNADLEITGYRFQRCRSSWRSELESPAVSELIVHKTMADLRGMLSQDGSLVERAGSPVPEAARDLMTVLVQSAIKTRVVTGIVWAQEVGSIKAASMSRAFFGDAAQVNQQVGLYDEATMAKLSGRGLADPIGFDRSRVYSWQVNVTQDVIGGVYFTPWAAGDEHAMLWWVFAVDGRILSVEDSQGSLEPQTSELFQKLIGRKFGEKSKCKTACELAALEVTLLYTKD